MRIRRDKRLGYNIVVQSALLVRDILTVCRKINKQIVEGCSEVDNTAVFVAKKENYDVRKA